MPPLFAGMRRVGDGEKGFAAVRGSRLLSAEMPQISVPKRGNRFTNGGRIKGREILLPLGTTKTVPNRSARPGQDSPGRQARSLPRMRRRNPQQARTRRKARQRPLRRDGHCPPTPLPELRENLPALPARNRPRRAKPKDARMGGPHAGARTVPALRQPRARHRRRGDVPSTNNATERAIGSSKIRSKTVRGCESESGLLNGFGLTLRAWSGADGLELSELIAA